METLLSMRNAMRHFAIVIITAQGALCKLMSPGLRNGENCDKIINCIKLHCWVLCILVNGKAVSI